MQQPSKQSSTLCARLLLLITVCYNTLKQRVIHFLKKMVNISVAKWVYSKRGYLPLFSSISNHLICQSIQAGYN